jgi:hypothetical protein
MSLDECNELFDWPMMPPFGTAEAMVHLQARGFDATISRLNYLVKAKSVKPKYDGRNLVWQIEDIEKAALILEEQGYVTEFAIHCKHLGCTVYEYRRAFIECYKNTVKEFGKEQCELLNESHFEMIRTPRRAPRAGCTIKFNLCSDVRKALEQNKPLAMRKSTTPIDPIMKLTK